MKRINFVDTTKALLLFLVIIGHSVTGVTPLFKYIFAFHMPAFFFLSGYCYKHREDIRVRDYAIAKAKSCLIPYCIFCAIGLIIMAIFKSWRIEASFGDFVLKYLFYTQPPALGQSWFLVALFMTTILFFIIMRCLEGCKVITKALVFVFFAVAGVRFYRIFTLQKWYSMPWKMDVALCMVGFMALGYCFKKLDIFEKLGKFNLILACVLPVPVYFIGVKWNSYVNVCDCIYGNPVFFYSAAVTGIIWICSLGWTFRNLRLLQFLGRNTLPIFGIHSFVLWAYIRLYCKITLIETPHLNEHYFVALIVSLLTYATCVPFAVVYNSLLLRHKKL